MPLIALEVKIAFARIENYSSVLGDNKGFHCFEQLLAVVAETVFIQLVEGLMTACAS